MRPQTFDVDLDTEDTAYYANDDAGGDGAAITLAANSTADGLAHKIVWTPATGTGVSGNLTLVGTDADGKALSETVATNGANAITSTGYFLTLTSATNPTVGSNTVDLGFADEVATKTYPIDWRSPYQCNIHVDVTGTINFTVQELWQNVFDVTDPQQNGAWVNITALASKTADTASQATNGATAVRLLVNSYSAGAELQMYLNQPASDD